MKHVPDFKIVGEKVILVPYRMEHVMKYHDWMSDEEIRRLTGSDRLTLEEEFEMQYTWFKDADKCTFIILSKQLYDTYDGDELLSMVGDTNLFLRFIDENSSEAEIEIMIADKSVRRQGLAYEAVRIMMNYGRKSLNIHTFTAKIKKDNTSSIALFLKLGFHQISESEVFQEVSLQLKFV